MSAITWSVTADFDRNGSFDFDLGQYIDHEGMDIRVSRGIGRDGKPQTTKFGLTLSNADGTFTPENSASALYGLLRPGVPVRVTATHLTIDYTIVTGYAMRWKPTFRAGVHSTCQVECEDILWFLQNGDPVNVTADATRNTSDALIAIMDALGLVAGDRTFDTGVQDLPMHFCVGEVPLEAMMAVVASEMGGLLYPAADGTLRFEARDSRLGVAAPVGTWGNGQAVGPEAEEYDLNPFEFFTNVTARSTVFRSGQADTRIFEFSQNMFTKPTATSMALTAGEIWQRTFQANSAYISLTTPDDYVDYTANASANGTGTDKTSALTVTVTDHGGGRFTLQLKNTDAGTIYVTKFQLRGQPVEFFADRAEAQFSLSVSGMKTGKALQFDVPFAGDTGAKLRDYAYQELRVGRYPWPVMRLPFKAITDGDIAALLAVDLGQQYRYASASDLFQSAMVDDWWYIEAIDYLIPAGWAAETFNCTVAIIPSYVYRDLDHITFDTFDRANASGDLGTSFSGDVWANDTGFDIASNAARANATALQVPNVAVTV